ncbi:MAG: NADH-quinone oxidoreductase subunit L [Lentisphaeria bacterium]|nr:NADH-quinone oxidoreductase subunit L [Lentisphaeria bacterium]
MMEWSLCALLGVPLLAGILSWIVPSARVRSVLVGVAAFAVVASGLAVVYGSMQAAEGIWEFAIPAKCEWIASVLEAVIILVILGIGIRTKNWWITVFAVLQVLLAAGIWCLPTEHHGDFVTVFRVDSLSRIMLLVTAIVGGAITVFSLGYMKSHAKHAPDTAASLGQFYFFFLAFLGFMAGLVMSDNLAAFSFFWEATTLCSYALIGQDGGEARRVNAARALLLNSLGGVFLLAGVYLLKSRTGGESFQLLLEKHSITLLPAILLCLAAFTKSALFPFQSWLLGAMVAPTPVSAMLHAATMVKAGVYLVMRLTPGFYDERAMTIVAFAGALTFVGGALLACTQSNAKKVLAYSTISNLGLVVACAGINTPLAYAAGLSIISFHAISKGLLFLCVGRIEQVIGSRDIEDMDGMYYRMPYTTCVAWVGMVSMLLPPFGMLLSKWLAIEATILSPFLLIFMVTGSALTVFFWAKWIGKMQNTGYHRDVPGEVIPSAMRVSLGFLALLVLVTGASTMFIFKYVFDPMARAVYHRYADINWCIFNEAGASTVTSLIIYGGVVLGLIIYYWFFWRKFDEKNIRLPYLCGENITSSELKSVQGARSYDFRSVGGKIEHSHFSNIYFHGIISEGKVTSVLVWAAWLIIVVLIGVCLAK